MDIHNKDERVKNYRKLRSNSIKSPTVPLSVAFTVKLNSKKFPVDFFSREAITPCRSRQPVSEQRIQALTSERRPKKCLDEIYANQLPEAQITSFFKINCQSLDTAETALSKHSGLENETKISASDLDCIITKQIASSIQLFEKHENSLDLCCTFSKMPVVSSRMVTPEKKDGKLSVMRMQQNKNQEALQSARVSRPYSKKEGRGNSLNRLRKNSIDKIWSNKLDLDPNNVQSSRKVFKKETIQNICLPPISGKH